MTTTVEDEIAFALCNLGLTAAQVVSRVEAVLCACGIACLRDRKLASLSGGQKQLVCLASALALRPRVLLLDEPYSMLDDISRQMIRDVLTRMPAYTAIIQTSHRTDELQGFNHVLALGDGRVLWAGTPQELDACEGLAATLGLRKVVALTSPPRSYGDMLHSRGWTLRNNAAFSAYASNIERDRGKDMADLSETLQARSCCYTPAQHASGMLSAFSSRATTRATDDVCFALRDVSLAVELGTLTLLVGKSGSGKSTCAGLLAGLLKPDAGQVSLSAGPVSAGSVGYVFQRVEDQLFKPTVIDDVAVGPRNRHVNRLDSLKLAEEALEDVGLDSVSFAKRNPLCLSGGQKRRVGIAGVLALQSDFLIFDEPTIGLDVYGVHDLLELLERLLAQGRGVLVVTHELETFLSLAHCVVVMADGRVTGVYRRGSEHAGRDSDA